MIHNYVTLSYRKFRRQKFYSLLNILGLATSMASVLLILLYVLDELSYDRFHQQEKLLYRVVENQHYSDQPVFSVAVTPGPLASYLKNEFPDIDIATHAMLRTFSFLADGASLEDVGAYVDPEFLKMFTFPLVRGDENSALNQPNNIVITEKLAAKLFGNADPIGRVVRINQLRDVTISGILKNIPENSHLQFSFLAPYQQALATMPPLH
jgi:putative ABC transport system permease protein